MIIDKHRAIFKLFVSFFLATLISGCVFVKIDPVKQMKPTGPKVNASLHAEYIQLAEGEAEKSNFLTSSFFASKARLAARGEPVPPEALDAWNIPKKNSETLRVARARLIVALAETRRVTSPGKAARAQAMFDCWVAKTDSATGTAHAALCKAKFADALATLQSGLAAAK
jgi:OmpA-OmpF porin, OOP family